MGAPGCDDAPVITAVRGMHMRRLTFINPYYDNPNWLMVQLNYWQALERKDRIDFIVVDDGSPKHPAEGVIRRCCRARDSLNLRLFRINVDVRWNWLAARNIAWHHMETEWGCVTDIDHVLRDEVVETLVWGVLDPTMIYRFSRIEHTGTKIHPHPNSWLMTKAMYWKVGGYDEALSGYYGTDSEYRRRCAATAPIRILSDELVRYEHIGDSSTLGYLRKQKEDAKGKQMIRARGRAWKPKVLTFPYEEIRL